MKNGVIDIVRVLLDKIPTPTPEQLVALDEHGDPKEWGVMEEMMKLKNQRVNNNNFDDV